jgi:DNA-binding NarL/FixJ family response regulator
MGSYENVSRELTVVVADAQVVTRIGVRRALEAGGLPVVAEASTANEAVAAAVAHRPDICLIAVDIAGGGILAAEQIDRAVPETRIVMLTDVECGDDLFHALRAGALGYLLRTTSAGRLPRALRGVVDGEAALPRTLTARLIHEFRSRTLDRRQRVTVAGTSVELTARESQIMECLRRDEPTAKIAQDLHISEITVRRHISTVVRKLGAPNRRAVVQQLRGASELRVA